MAGMVTYAMWDSEVLAKTGGTATTAAMEISTANALALHVTALTGTATIDVTFTYSLSNSREGTYVTPASPVTIGANVATADVLDFSPEAARFIKITATNNHATATATVSALLVVQEL